MLAIINPTEKTLRLPKTVMIANYRPAKFIKEVGTKDSEAMLVLGPDSPKRIPALNKDGFEVQICRLKATEMEREVIKKAESMYANYVNSENLLIQAFLNGEITEDFPKAEPDRVPDTIREYQAETNRQEEHSEEFLEYPNLKVEADTITLTEYSLLGELPISDKSGIHGTSIGINWT